MKKFTSIFLLFIIVLQTFSLFVIQAEYFLNKDYVARVLCINKDKPILHCNGKCYLTSQLKEQERKEQQAPTFKKDKFEVQQFFLPDQLSFTGMLLPSKTKYYQPKEFIDSPCPGSVFHPPTTV